MEDTWFIRLLEFAERHMMKLIVAFCVVGAVSTVSFIYLAMRSVLKMILSFI
jgi:hypothetical protein